MPRSWRTWRARTWCAACSASRSTSPRSPIACATASRARLLGVRKTLVLFATTHGQTARIAQRIAAILAEGGAVDVVELRRFGRVPPLAGYDTAVLAGSVHFGRHQRRLERFIRANHEALGSMDAAFVSVSGSAIDDDGRPDAEGDVLHLAHPTRLRAGRRGPPAGPASVP